MDQEIKPQKLTTRRLPTSLTTITPFSKALAMVMFVTLPFVGFYLGMLYQRKSAIKCETVLVNKNSIPTPTPILLPSITTIPSLVTTITANGNLNKYLSKNYNFSFSYPANWNLTGDEENGGMSLYLKNPAVGQIWFYADISAGHGCGTGGKHKITFNIGQQSTETTDTCWHDYYSVKATNNLNREVDIDISMNAGSEKEINSILKTIEGLKIVK